MPDEFRVSILRVGVIGGAGRMGAWFVRYFTERGLKTIVNDINVDVAKSLATSTGAEFSALSKEALGSLDIVLIAVPIEAMAEVVASVAPKLREGAALVEISSIKSPVMKAMKKALKEGIVPLSLHPLFGPDTGSLESERIVLVPVADEPQELEIAKRLFPEAEIISSGTEEHDRAMAVVLSLTYFVNLAFSGALRDVDIKLVKRLAGTTFTVQLVLAESILGESPELVATLMGSNPFADSYINEFVSWSERIRDDVMGDGRSFMSLFGSLALSMRRDSEFPLSNERRHKAYRAIRN
jgi:prephenate dehydrogenase